MATRTGQRQMAAVIVLIGAVLLITALLVPWYSYKSERQGGPLQNYGAYNETYYLDPPTAPGAIQYSCGGFVSCPSQNSYSSGSQNSTGLVAGICFFLVAMGGLIGVIAGVWGVVSRGAAQRTSPHIVLAVLAMFLGIAASLYFGLALPGAFSSDLSAQRSSFSNGPWSSFYGSATYNTAFLQFNLNWGPLIGWYLSVAAAVLLFAGAFFLYRYRRDPPEAAPVSVPVPSEAVIVSAVPAPPAP